MLDEERGSDKIKNHCHEKKCACGSDGRAPGF